MAIGRTISYLGMPFPNGKIVKNLSNGNGANQGIPLAGKKHGVPHNDNPGFQNWYGLY